MNSKFFVIWGMHRGGTSLLAAAMKVFGAQIHGKIIAADYFNPRGYFETTELISLNEAMFADLGERWYSLGYIGAEQIEMLVRAGHLEKAIDFLQKQAAQGPLILLKDPRMSRLGGLWNRAFQSLDIEPYSIVPWRNPAAVGISLRRRAQNLKIPTPLIDERYGWLLWLAYMRAALVYSQPWPRAIVAYDKFIADPQGSLDAIGRTLNVTVDREALEDFCVNFVDAGMNHYLPRKDELEMPSKVQALYELLSSSTVSDCPDISELAWEPSSEERLLSALLDEANHKIRDTAAKMASIHSEICLLTRECKRMALELAKKQE